MKQLYFIAIQLPDPPASDIIALKESLAEKYQAVHALKTPPHITLQMPMRIELDREAELLQTFQSIQHEEGSISLQGVDSFPPRTIFIDVAKDKWLETIKNKVKVALHKSGFINDDQLTSSFHPHMTLMTRDLSKKNFSGAMRELKDMRFDREVEINAFQLYKHDGKRWEIFAKEDL